MLNPEWTAVPGSPGCFVCDNNGSNPKSLGLRLYWDETEKNVQVPFLPTGTWCSFDNVVHGGLVAAVLDEAMGWAVKLTLDEWAFTAECNVRYKRVLEPGVPCRATARVTEDKGRVIIAQARLLDPENRLLAQATATFLPVKGRARPRS